jgi:mannose-6-phosphate isomerase-like protein (cupin superfamily)
MQNVAEVTLETKRLPAERFSIAPDGSDVRLLLGVAGGGMAHFEIGPGQTSVATVHRSVEEIWYFVNGRGQMWRRLGEREEMVDVEVGTCLSIPVGTKFQFRSFGYEPLAAIGVTMPPWPGAGEATLVEGKWTPTLEPGPV